MARAVETFLDGFRKVRDLLQRKFLFLRDPDSLHQISCTTAMNRYPWLFEAVRAQLGDRSGLKLLSFGCATGEEVFSLRRYFEQAEIVGTDINWASVRRARRANTDARNRFVTYRPSRIAAEGPFDAILCLAVLQRYPSQFRGAASLKAVYPFERFDRQLQLFDEWLAPGGVLVVFNTNYRFCDAAIAGRYDALPVRAPVEDWISKYDRNSQLVEGSTYEDAVFVKRAVGAKAAGVR